MGFNFCTIIWYSNLPSMYNISQHQIKNNFCFVILLNKTLLNIREKEGYIIPIFCSLNVLKIIYRSCQFADYNNSLFSSDALT